MSNKQQRILLSENLSPLKLEIETTKLLKLGFGRRGFTIIHNGNMKNKASGGKPDIEVFNDNFHINVEVTKTKKSQADREFNSIKDHLLDAIKKYPAKKCFCLYISPETFKRNMDSFSLFNRGRDEKIYPMDFATFNIFIEYLIEHDEKYFGIPELKKLFTFQIKTSTTDADILEFINRVIIKNPRIEKQIRDRRIKERIKKDREIESNMRKIHNMLRTKYGQNPDEAVKEVSKIIFLKMYEEDKELKNPEHENRCTIKKLEQIKKQGQKDPINYVFNLVKDEMKGEEPDAIIFESNEKINLDEKTINRVLELINGYSFVTMDTDIKGKIYELYLGSTMKNTALGQYFTPEEIINFIIKISDLKVKDLIFDPCCGTGRFLTKAMDYLVDKAEKTKMFDDNDIEDIKKKQIFGIDLSKSVYKIARMNMYIHGDGKTNIKQDNMITYNPTLKIKDNGETKIIDLKGKFSVILTNPPFGDVNIVNDIKDFETYEQQIINEFNAIDIEKKNNKKHVKERSYKGGSLLLQRSSVFLKTGGSLITVIDDGVLNTESYKRIRELLIKNYHIRAVISLPHTTFKRLAKSSPKASILYLVKKNNPLDKQELPIFFAHAEMIGIDTRGRECRNDFNEIAKKFKQFLSDVDDNLISHNGFFNRDEFHPINSHLYNEEMPIEKFFDLMPYVYTKYIDEIDDRLDFNYNHPKYERKIKELRETALYPIIPISDIIKKDKNGKLLITSGTTPKNIRYLEKGEGIPFLGATSIRNNTVDFDACQYIDKKVHNTKLKSSIITGEYEELLITMAGTIGRCGVYPKNGNEANINQAIAKVTLDTTKAIPKYVSIFLNSFYGQVQFYKKRHDVGTPNINLEEIKTIEVVLPDSTDEQKRIVKQYEIYEKEKIKLLEKIKENMDNAYRKFDQNILNMDIITPSPP